MRQPRKSRPSSMWVIKVFSGDRRSPIVARTSAVSSRRVSASALVPAIMRHQSSAYADRRIMPSVVAEVLVSGG
jgi:hypothetical protein